MGLTHYSRKLSAHTLESPSFCLSLNFFPFAFMHWFRAGNLRHHLNFNGLISGLTFNHLVLANKSVSYYLQHIHHLLFSTSDSLYNTNVAALDNSYNNLVTVKPLKSMIKNKGLVSNIQADAYSASANVLNHIHLTFRRFTKFLWPHLNLSLHWPLMFFTQLYSLLFNPIIILTINVFSIPAFITHTLVNYLLTIITPGLIHLLLNIYDSVILLYYSFSLKHL